ncbi:MAG: helix-turn-helix transcriptional regulator [Thermoplasmata archaeon]|nr:helix-turn-helix transcriptional regulator [Thermoplasmata archaeon]
MVMAPAPTSAQGSRRPTRSLVTGVISADEEIERGFREFREAAVRLVERVSDTLGTVEDPVASAQADLRIVRSIFGKWSADVLLVLHSVPAIGFEQLRRSLLRISPRVLSQKLKELEQAGMVQREIVDSRPPRVKYSLTERGWTVTWLAQPILLFLRLSEKPASAVATSPAPPAPVGFP